ncbi:MAG: hypothetical protein HKL81_05425 [Acidimicrobiaceae bacterium]|nr:hypothetical protein [Acidimicrobiaceae bacterium]
MEINHEPNTERDSMAKPAVDLEQAPDHLTELLVTVKDQMAQIDSILRGIEEP